MRSRPTAKPVPRIWSGHTAAVLATGPSLDDAQCAKVRRTGWRVIAVNDAYRLMPDADCLYGCDAQWWDWHNGVPEFAGAKLCHDPGAAKRHGLRWLPCRKGDGFSSDPTYTHCGGSSGYQAANLAFLLGAERIVLLGFDNRPGPRGQTHFFGEHPDNSGQQHFRLYAKSWRSVSPVLDGVEIWNATPKSALPAIPKKRLEDLL